MVGCSFFTTLKNEVAKGPISEDERIYDTIYNELNFPTCKSGANA